MLILELVQDSQTIRCLGLRAVRCRVNTMYFGEAESLSLYNTWGIKLVIQRRAQESVGLSRNKPETSAEAQTLGEWLRALWIPKPWGSNVFVARTRQADPQATNLYRLWKLSSQIRNSVSDSAVGDTWASSPLNSYSKILRKWDRVCKVLVYTILICIGLLNNELNGKHWSKRCKAL